jgi:hypothetical protein
MFIGTLPQSSLSFDTWISLLSFCNIRYIDVAFAVKLMHRSAC